MARIRPDQQPTDGQATDDQPTDEWTFLRPDEFVDDEAVEPADDQAVRGPEDRAMHVEHSRRPITDPGRSEVDVDPGQDEHRDTTYFDDEQPDGARPSDDEPEVEPDLEEILESQHYAFRQPPDDAG